MAFSVLIVSIFVAVVRASTPWTDLRNEVTNLVGSNERCLTTDLTFTTNAGCTENGLNEFLVDVQAELDSLTDICAHDAVEELMLALGLASREGLQLTLEHECQTFWATEAATVNLNSLMEDNDVFLKAYFDGGTNWNDLRETTDSSGDPLYVAPDDFAAINDLYTSFSTTPSVVQFPEIENFDDCALNMVMCCFVSDRRPASSEQNDVLREGDCAEGDCADADPSDNTDVCYADYTRFPSASHVAGGLNVFPGDTEGPVDCEGFVWSDYELDESYIFRGNTLFQVAMFQKFYVNGYVGNIPGSPMCGCLEKMAVVDTAECTQPYLTQEVTFTLTADSTLTIDIDPSFTLLESNCEGLTNAQSNDLESHYLKLVSESKVEDQSDAVSMSLVGEGNCPAATSTFLASFGTAATAAGINLEDYGLSVPGETADQSIDSNQSAVLSGTLPGGVNLGGVGGNTLPILVPGDSGPAGIIINP